MIRSMTGFGQAQSAASGCMIQIDVKSVNHRYCEIAIRLPKEWHAFEEAARKAASDHVKRGRVDLFVSVQRQEESRKAALVNWTLVDGYMQAAELMRERYGLKDELTLPHLLQLADVVTLQDERLTLDEQLEALFHGCLSDALQQLVAMREREGAALAQDLLARLQELDRLYDAIRVRAPIVSAEYGLKLKSRVQEWIGDSEAADEGRLLTEIALFADRCSVDEELTRLHSHFEQFRMLLQSDEPVGRKLDFLIQELNREVNTIGSKANDAEIALHVIDMKAELEKMREQVQNIE